MVLCAINFNAISLINKLTPLPTNYSFLKNLLFFKNILALLVLLTHTLNQNYNIYIHLHDVLLLLSQITKSNNIGNSFKTRKN